jgi:hypothetical protein
MVHYDMEEWELWGHHEQELDGVRHGPPWFMDASGPSLLVDGSGTQKKNIYYIIKI